MRRIKITKNITQRDEGSVGRYFQDVNKFKMISAEEEVELSIRIRNGDPDALDKLVVANLRFVISVAKQFQNQGLSFSDLINEGNVGLVKAAKKFDETRGFKFISYAVWWIRQTIIQAISDQTRIVRLPLNRISSIHKIERALPYLEQEFEREPTDSEIAMFLDLTYDEVKQANYNKRRQISFDMPLSHDSDNDFSLYDIIPVENVPSPDSKMMQESMSTNISRVLKKLSEKESGILTMSFGLRNSPVYSLHDIAFKLNMSTERVRQIKSSGLSKLKLLLNRNNAFME
jgi:RNA polymerase primary sigma factor